MDETQLSAVSRLIVLASAGDSSAVVFAEVAVFGFHFHSVLSSSMYFAVVFAELAVFGFHLREFRTRTNPVTVFGFHLAVLVRPACRFSWRAPRAWEGIPAPSPEAGSACGFAW